MRTIEDLKLKSHFHSVSASLPDLSNQYATRDYVLIFYIAIKMKTVKINDLQYYIIMVRPNNVNFIVFDL
jgi:hypothetical protein